MQSEIEAKFTNVDHEDIRARLAALGAFCEQPLRLMRRVVFHSAAMETKNGFLRIRDEGHQVTMTYKQFDGSGTIHGVKEVETTVGDFDAAITICEQAGMVKESYQETRRETWRLGEAEIVLDEWPWIDPFIEIEAPTEEIVKLTAHRLGFDFDDALFGGVAVVYLQQYGHDNDAKSFAEIINRKVPIIRFEDPVPEIIVTGAILKEYESNLE